MKLCTVDFETYYDADYTLRKLTTEAYVRDARYKTHCVGIKVGATPTKVFPDMPASAHWSNVGMIAQKAHFDGLILSHHYGIKPKLWIDTLSMARLLHPHWKSHSLEAIAKAYGLPTKTVPYDLFRGVRDLPPDIYQQVADGCAHDCDLTYQAAMVMLPHVPKEELRLIDMTVRMFTEPQLNLHVEYMEWYLQRLIANKDAVLAQLGTTKEELSSAEKFATLLRRVGIEPPLKKSPRKPLKECPDCKRSGYIETCPTCKGAGTVDNMIYAFAKDDDAMREMEDHEDERVQVLVTARLGVKSTGNETRAQRMLDMYRRGHLAVYLNYCGAHTTRWSGGDKMNWQNYKRIDFDGKGEIIEGDGQRGWIRLSIVAPPGQRIVVGDLSQIECRMLNWLAGQVDVLDKFRRKEDIYSDLAGQFYGRAITKKDKAERGTGKQLELSCGYGAGIDTIVSTAKLGIYGPPVMLTREQGKAARDLYRTTHPYVVHLWKFAEQVLSWLVNGHNCEWGPMRIQDKRIWGPNGTFLDYTNLGYSEDGFYVATRKGNSRMYGAKLIENVVQWLARIVMSQAMLRIAERSRPVMTTHDEVACLALEAQAEELLQFMLAELVRVPDWCPGIPLDAEGGHDVRYSK